ncbi:MAG: radical SAM protein [Phycisphaerae bacterium]
MLRVERIQRYCLDDGPGIRTTVFCQGCPLRCWWCHNPETQPFDADVTPWPPEILVDTLLRDRRYWQASGGGVTFSGGEPLAQADSVSDAVDELKSQNVNVAICTSAQATADAIDQLADGVDHWLVDLKCVDADRYHEATGGTAETALENLANLIDRRGPAVTVRVPLIAGFNDDRDELAKMAGWLASQSVAVPVEILPGHDLCRRPGRRSAKPSDLAVNRACEIFTSAGLASTMLSGVL